MTESDISKEDQAMADSYGITAEQKTVYHYAGHKYDRFKDALNYAKVDPDAAERAEEG